MPAAVARTPYRTRASSAFVVNSSADEAIRSAALPTSQNSTICCWAILRVDRNSFNCVFSLDNNNTGSASYHYIETDSGGLALSVYSEVGGGGSASAAMFTAVPGVPYFFAMTSATAGAGALDAYWRRTEDKGLSTTSTTGRNFTPARLRFGNNLWTEWWDGMIWDAMAFDRVLDQRELMRLSIDPISCLDMRGLHAWWPLDGSLIRGTYDFSGYGRHLTYSSTPQNGPNRFPRSLVDRVRKRGVGHISGGLSGSLGLVTETDTAQNLAKLKAKTLGLVTETDLAQALTRVKAQVIGFPTETDTAFALGRLKARQLGLVTETDLSQALQAGGIIEPIGLVTETDTAQSLARAKLKAVGLVTETNLSQSFTRVKARSIGLVSETDSALSFARLKAKAIDRVLEIDIAQSLSSGVVAPVIRAIRRLVSMVGTALHGRRRR